jgi:lysyl-tRNA synthetase class 2
LELLRSSVIRSADYDPEAQTLDIVFRAGRHYAYFGVPEHVFDALIMAASAGEYFNTHIRDQYSCRERL